MTAVTNPTEASPRWVSRVNFTTTGREVTGRFRLRDDAPLGFPQIRGLSQSHGHGRRGARGRSTRNSPVLTPGCGAEPLCVTHSGPRLVPVWSPRPAVNH